MQKGVNDIINILSSDRLPIFSIRSSGLPVSLPVGLPEN